MLGLGVNLAGRKGKRVVYKYTSDFSDSYDAATDLIVPFSVQGNLTFTANFDATLDGEANDWLKIEYDTNQTDGSGSGVELDGTSSRISSGDIIQVDYKIYIVNNTNAWGPNNTIGLTTSCRNSNTTTYITANSTVSYSKTLTAGSGSAANLIIARFNIPEDKPQAGAIFYLKDIIVTVTR
jgi:hypothetical protein